MTYEELKKQLGEDTGVTSVADVSDCITFE